MLFWEGPGLKKRGDTVTPASWEGGEEQVWSFLGAAAAFILIGRVDSG